MPQPSRPLPLQVFLRSTSLLLGVTYFGIIIGALAVMMAPLQLYVRLREAWVVSGWQHGTLDILTASAFGMIVALTLIHAGLRSEPERRLARRLMERRRQRRLRALVAKRDAGDLGAADAFVALPDRRPIWVLRCLGMRRQVTPFENTMLAPMIAIALAGTLFLGGVVLLNSFAPSLVRGTGFSIHAVHPTAEQGSRPSAVPSRATHI